MGTDCWRWGDVVPGLTSLEESKDLDRSVWLRTRRFPSLSLGFLTWRMATVGRVSGTTHPTGTHSTCLGLGWVPNGGYERLSPALTELAQQALGRCCDYQAGPTEDPTPGEMGALAAASASPQLPRSPQRARPNQDLL